MFFFFDLDTRMSNTNVSIWHDYVENADPKRLNEILADDAVFYSPVVHTPQRGKAIVSLYLTAASEVFFGAQFEYVGEWLSDDGAVLEFTTEIDGIVVNGVDMMRFNDEGKISEFKVLIRPLKAVHMIHQKMGMMLEEMSGS